MTESFAGTLCAVPQRDDARTEILDSSSSTFLLPSSFPFFLSVRSSMLVFPLLVPVVADSFLPLCIAVLSSVLLSLLDALGACSGGVWLGPLQVGRNPHRVAFISLHLPFCGVGPISSVRNLQHTAFLLRFFSSFPHLLVIVMKPFHARRMNASVAL